MRGKRHEKNKTPLQRKKPVIAHGLSFFDGAEGETRTRMTVRSLDPEPSVSTSSTTSATGGFLPKTAGQCNRIFTKTAKGLLAQPLCVLFLSRYRQLSAGKKFYKRQPWMTVSFFVISAPLFAEQEKLSILEEHIVSPVAKGRRFGGYYFFPGEQALACSWLCQ